MPPGLLPGLGLLAQERPHSSQQADGRVRGGRGRRGAVVSLKGAQIPVCPFRAPGWLMISCGPGQVKFVLSVINTDSSFLKWSANGDSKPKVSLLA